MSLYSKLPNPSSDSVSFLRTIPLFSELAEKELEEIAAQLTNRKFAPGITLFHQEMPGTMMYIIEKGSVRVFAVGLTGQEHTLNTFGPGDIFGELSIIDGNPRSASAITMSEACLWLISRQDLDALFARYPSVARKMMITLVDRVRTAASHVEAIIFQDVLGRLAYEIYILTERHGRPMERGVKIAMPLTQTDLSTIVGATRESVNKSIQHLRNENLIELDGAHLIVLDRKRLLEIVQERGR